MVIASVSTWLHVGACVLLPLAWGVATEMVFRRLARRRPSLPVAAPDQHFFIDYHI
jgi:hypothetical protein